MKNILIVGYGDIASRVAPLLCDRYRLFGLIRNPAKAKQLRDIGVTPLLGELDQPASLKRLGGLAQAVIHLAPPPNTGSRDSRTQHLLAALSGGNLPQQLIYISTSGVYGDCAGARVSETRALNPQSARAQRRVDAEQQIRRWATRNHVSASILRVPGIYSKERLPIQRLHSATPAIVAAEDGCTNHIHADDLARIVLAALHSAKPNRVYNASDDSQLKMGDYFDMVADIFELPRPPRLSRAEVQSSVSPTMWSFMNESRRLVNQRIKKELKVELLYSSVEEALPRFKEN
ncbi:MAG: SDR family oxidoreductase [Gallionellaceae bacterium]|nr:SDR family oxidoreductase [Gallionellaceae bacterium]